MGDVVHILKHGSTLCGFHWSTAGTDEMWVSCQDRLAIQYVNGVRLCAACKRRWDEHDVAKAPSNG